MATKTPPIAPIVKVKLPDFENPYEGIYIDKPFRIARGTYITSGRLAELDGKDVIYRNRDQVCREPWHYDLGPELRRMSVVQPVVWCTEWEEWVEKFISSKKCVYARKEFKHHVACGKDACTKDKHGAPLCSRHKNTEDARMRWAGIIRFE